MPAHVTSTTVTSIGSPTTSAPGSPQDEILDVSAVVLNQTLKATIVPVGEYCDKFYSPWINGVYQGANAYVKADPTFLYSVPTGSDVASIYFGDAGDWADYSDESAFSVVPGSAAGYESQDANRILFTWNPNYCITAVNGDTQLSALVITNPARGVNLAPGSLPTRGDLTYAITTTGTTHVISWYAGNRLVAQGSVTGNGVFTCSQMGGSTLTVTGVLTYTTDLVPGIATLEICWPASYEVHYDTSPLTFPRTPQYTLPDQNAVRYLYLSPILGGATYYYTVLTVDDQGNEQVTNIPTPPALIINAAPPPVTNLTASGSASALTVSWVPGEVNDEFYVYYSLIGAPVNFGEYALPAPVWCDFNTTSVTLPPILGYAPVDRSGYIATMQLAFDAQEATIMAAYVAGETGFVAALEAALENMITAAVTYGQAVSAPVYGILETLNGQIMQLESVESYLLPLGLTTASWQQQMYSSMASFISYLGSAVYGQYQNYTMPDGTSGPQTSSYVGDNLTSMCDPVVLPGTVRIVVRAQNADGVQEHNDQQLDVIFDAFGNVIGAAPNAATITSITPTELTATVLAQLIDDDSEAVADTCNLYVVSVGSPVDINSPQSTSPFSTPSGFNVQTATVQWTVPLAGTYSFYVAAVANGVIGNLSSPVNVYIGPAQNVEVNNLLGQVQRGQG